MRTFGCASLVLCVTLSACASLGGDDSGDAFGNMLLGTVGALGAATAIAGASEGNIAAEQQGMSTVQTAIAIGSGDDSAIPPAATLAPIT
ncbi:MAG: hypothetical protein WAW96_01320, partial [Alphaproteobacteria bacterium]